MSKYLKIRVFWDMTSCTIIKRLQSFGGIRCLQLHGVSVIFRPEDGSSILLWNVVAYLQNYISHNPEDRMGCLEGLESKLLVLIRFLVNAPNVPHVCAQTSIGSSRTATVRRKGDEIAKWVVIRKLLRYICISGNSRVASLRTRTATNLIFTWSISIDALWYRRRNSQIWYSLQTKNYTSHLMLPRKWILRLRVSGVCLSYLHPQDSMSYKYQWGQQIPYTRLYLSTLPLYSDPTTVSHDALLELILCSSRKTTW
jgi:hypothetical protein